VIHNVFYTAAPNRKNFIIRVALYKPRKHSVIFGLIAVNRYPVESGYFNFRTKQTGSDSSLFYGVFTHIMRNDTLYPFIINPGKQIFIMFGKRGFDSPVSLMEFPRKVNGTFQFRETLELFFKPFVPHISHFYCYAAIFCAYTERLTRVYVGFFDAIRGNEHSVIFNIHNIKYTAFSGFRSIIEALFSIP